ncbi:MAG TPA: C69 family dipeptidase, partial [Bacteroidales bacterium]|nr:C69 family dipeptidase [Bacteroidales bacterium]
MACTSVLVSRGASADGSVITSWTYDVAGYAAPFHFYPGGTYPEGDSLRLYCFRENQYIGSILQIPRTYRVVGNMNEKQVSIGETTFTGREELHGGNGFIDYGNLIFITLQRASTARDAIRIMDELVKKYGYSDTGEIFSIADEEEAWMLEFIGKGKHGRGAIWVAARVPEGYMAAHANQARIREINWADTINWMWSPDVVDFARKMGWFTGSDEDFNFTDAYAPVTPRSLLLCESRVWSIYNRAAPSANLSSDFWRGVVGAEPYPLFIKPDKKITVQDVIAFHRDHFHNTPYYTGKGIAAAPYGNPYRWRPVVFQLEGDTISQYAWKRPVSQPQTAFSYITQARNWLPDPIGGLVWYAVDDTYMTVWMPFYVATNRVPPSLQVANPIEFSWESAFWVFSLLNNFSYDLFNVVIADIKKAQQELENRSLSLIPALDKAGTHLYKHNSNTELLNDYLTNFAVNNAENV